MTDPSHLPEPEDPRDLPTPVTPVDPPTTRRVTITRTMHTDAAMARFADIASRPALWVGAVVGAVLLGWYASARRAGGGGIAIAALAGLVLVPVFGFLLGARVIRKLFPSGDEASVDISASGLTMTIPKGSFHADWDRFRRADIFREHLFLRMRGSAAAIVLPPELYARDDALEVARRGIASAAS